MIHKHGAISPGPVGGVTRPWYMHPHQGDNLIVLHGTRHVDLYNRNHGRIVSFMVTAERIEKEGALICDEPAMLVLAHRGVSSDQEFGRDWFRLAEFCGASPGIRHPYQLQHLRP